MHAFTDGSCTVTGTLSLYAGFTCEVAYSHVVPVPRASTLALYCAVVGAGVRTAMMFVSAAVQKLGRIVTSVPTLSRSYALNVAWPPIWLIVSPRCGVMTTPAYEFTTCSGVDNAVPSAKA